MQTTSDAAVRLRKLGDDLWNEAQLWPRESVQNDALKDASTKAHNLAAEIEGLDE